MSTSVIARGVLCGCMPCASAYISPGHTALRPRRQVGRVADTAGMHQLHKNPATLGADRISDQLPALHLFFIEQPGNPRIAQAIGRRQHALGEDQAGRFSGWGAVGLASACCDG